MVKVRPVRIDVRAKGSDRPIARSSQKSCFIIADEARARENT